MKLSMMVKIANERIRLRTQVENMIERMWIYAGKQNREAFSEAKEKYELYKNAMIGAGIPEEDINDYHQRAKNMEELLNNY